MGAGGGGKGEGRGGQGGDWCTARARGDGEGRGVLQVEESGQGAHMPAWEKRVGETTRLCECGYDRSGG